MEFILSSSFLLIVSFVCIGPGFLLAAVVAFLSIKKQLQSNSNRKDIMLSGVTEPAIVISARNDYFTGGGKNRASNGVTVTFEVEVQPAHQPAFRAKFSESLPIRAGDKMGERPGEAGTKVWVTYDPNDKSRIVLDHYDSNHEFATKRKEFEKIDKRNAWVRQNGVEAVATILEMEDLKLTDKLERDFMENTSLRLKLEVTPADSAPYQTDFMGMFSNSGLHKYQVGKKVVIKFNPQDKTQVALIRSMEN